MASRSSSARAVSWLPAMLKFHPLKVAELRVEPEEAIYLTFAVPPELRDEYRFEAGQHVGIRAVVEGEEQRRTYSIVSGPGEEGLKIAARLHDRGRMSGYLARDVHAGDALEVLTPNGSFHTRLATGQRRTIVAFAAGCGITPVMSIVKATFDIPGSRVFLFYGNRSTSRIMRRSSIAPCASLPRPIQSIHHFSDRTSHEKRRSSTSSSVKWCAK